MGSTQREYSHNMRVGSIRHISRDGAAPLGSISVVSFLRLFPRRASSFNLPRRSLLRRPSSLPPSLPCGRGRAVLGVVPPSSLELRRSRASLPPSPAALCSSFPLPPARATAAAPSLRARRRQSGAARRNTWRRRSSARRDGGGAARSCRGRITQSGREPRRSRAPNPCRGGGGAAGWRAARGGLAAAWPAGGE